MGLITCPGANARRASVVLRRAYLSRDGPIYPEAGLSVPRRAYLSRGGPIYPEAGLSRDVADSVHPRAAGSARGGADPSVVGWAALLTHLTAAAAQSRGEASGQKPALSRALHLQGYLAHKKPPAPGAYMYSRPMPT
ncbi:hypothetical protein T484DRAFT_1956258 [Baffinella frigidus]|nr:hypothetical protein T484DRAFT_1956258 [Cryptophyta sp. CCMP2293]